MIQLRARSKKKKRENKYVDEIDRKKAMKEKSKKKKGW